MIRFAALLAAGVAIAACEPRKADPDEVERLVNVVLENADRSADKTIAATQEEAASLDTLAVEFVKLALAVGQHDPAFVDAYHGPADWAELAETEQRPLDQLEADAQGLLISIRRANREGWSVRGEMLEKQLRAALTRIQMAQGRSFAFDEETRRLYDAVAPHYDIAEFDAALSKIDALLPGDGPLSERVEAFRNSLAIPQEKLQAVFDAAIAECRKRTLAHYDLPEAESFRMEFVTDKPWSGYNWYQGDYESLIQVNTDFPIIIDRAVDLGCHEGYPGHHTWNVFLERDLLEGAGWIEYSVYPLFSPMSVTAEGSANYGIELAFPGNEKIAFERDVLFPLAGLDPSMAETLEKLNDLRRKLSHARNMIARDYLDGKIDRETAIELSMKYRLESRERAEQSIRFIETYRGYVLNYNVGRDLVEGFVEREAAKNGGDRWSAFAILLTTPLSASDIATGGGE
ncbi:hypothetical protein [Hyphococcus sp.]|uniref:hypothetical protein n=1 Tax=Hyphococcus sp. TaxID=2038636 RepID=UPI0035C73407